MHQETLKANLEREKAALEDKLREEMSARERAKKEAQRTEELAAERVEAIKAAAARLELEATATFDHHDGRHDSRDDAISDEETEHDLERRVLQQKLAEERRARASAEEEKKQAEAESRRLSRLRALKSEKKRVELEEPELAQEENNPSGYRIPRSFVGAQTIGQYSRISPYRVHKEQDKTRKSDEWRIYLQQQDSMYPVRPPCRPPRQSGPGLNGLYW